MSVPFPLLLFDHDTGILSIQIGVQLGLLFFPGKRRRRLLRRQRQAGNRALRQRARGRSDRRGRRAAFPQRVPPQGCGRCAGGFCG